jgi:hypothetical protein
MVLMVIENIILFGAQGQQPTLTQARYILSATSVGKYALFGGGYTGSSASNVVDIPLGRGHPTHGSRGKLPLG